MYKTHHHLRISKATPNSKLQTTQGAPAPCFHYHVSHLSIMQFLNLTISAYSQYNPPPLASLTKLYGTFWPTNKRNVSTVVNALASATPYDVHPFCSATA